MTLKWNVICPTCHPGVGPAEPQPFIIHTTLGDKGFSFMFECPVCHSKHTPGEAITSCHTGNLGKEPAWISTSPSGTVMRACN